MLGQKTIKIRVDREGSATIETSGFKGADCLAATKELENALGAVESRTHKPEFYSQESVGLNVSAGG